MNPIIFIDELDKISNTENGKEIIGILTHMTDASQNDEFYDKYFAGIKIDLSKVLFIFSYNDPHKIDPVLADRIHRVKFKNLSKIEKIHVVNNYLLPEFLETVGFPANSIRFKDNVIEYIINNYTFEAGIRKLKQKIFEIIREINLRCFMDTNYAEFPIEITIDTVNEIFSDKPKIILKQIAEKSHIGLVNGLYATSVGNGGITIIETFKTPSESKLSLMITGQQGDVMQESVKCAKTIAWNILPNSIKKKIADEWADIYTWGIHVHCPEAATPKDGPSAGGAITLAIISLLCHIPVKNTVALTGEIDLNGSIHAIGGLDNKIEGAKMAGVKVLLYPAQNQQDIEIIRNIRPEVLQNIKIKPIENIWEILEYCLEDNDLIFNKYVV
jgi:ATP-dependent Lon protease